ncbi:cupin domain-containing protein [Streptomyces sp900116325]|uniref:JmjC domain-containing protein n=1 Tax=Streptomyces sp. 900116325 TaxID=3154295 RepID=UPI0033AC0A38
MSGLARCIPDEQTFFAEHWQKAPTVLRPSDPPLDVLALTDVDDILDSGLLRLPYMELVHANSRVSPERFCIPRIVLGSRVDGYVDANAVRSLVKDEGATLLLRYVDQWNKSVRNFTEEISDRLQRRVEAFYFVTPAGTQGRPIHRDDADVLAIQISGEKKWYVHDGPADGFWEPGRLEGDPGPVALETVLRPGEVLYVPRGFAHYATACGSTPSAHLSMTIREPGTANLYSLVQALLTQCGTVPQRPLTEVDLHEAAACIMSDAEQTLMAVTPEDLVHTARILMRGDRTPDRDRTLADWAQSGN